MKADELVQCLHSRFSHYPIAVTNKVSFLNAYCDADFVTVSMGAIVEEFEVKVSRSDYLRDAKKTRHKIYSDHPDYRGTKPNRFWYVTAPDIINLADLPSYAGWMELQCVS